VELEFAGQGYGVFKKRVADAVCEELMPLQQEYARIRADKSYLNDVIQSGAERAGQSAVKMLRKVQKKIGYAPRKI
jgi:tryptophanyl-tRNA synthetase